MNTNAKHKPKISFGDFLYRCQENFRLRYSYTPTKESDFLNGTVSVLCKKHGEFSAYWLDLYEGIGCPTCRKEKEYNDKRDCFIKKSKAKYGDSFDYSLIDYVRYDVPVTLICKTHGRFTTTPNRHLSFSHTGCPHCGRESALRKALAQRHTTEQFVEKAKAKHGDKFDYSLVKYINKNAPVEIICPEHGSFWQKPDRHLFSVHGCAQCSEHGFKPSAPHLLYLLKFQLDIATFWKIGITSRSIRQRYHIAGEYKRITEQITWDFLTGIEALRVEQEILRQFADYKMQFLFPLLQSEGDTECFTPKLPVNKVKSFINSRHLHFSMGK